jgi:2-polyprenyl-3-methyl-5-hydroxy-6-metoxy-1,4-benzoquinol methylase
MGTLHTIATEQYTEHYARMNPTVDPAKMPARLYDNMDLMFGDVIRALPAGSCVADLGCGTGFLLHWLAKHDLKLSGVDASATQADQARAAVPRATIFTGDILDFLQTRGDSFSALFCMDVLEHIKNDDGLLAILQNARQRLLPGGVFVCRVPNAAHLLGNYSRHIDITHHRGFTGPSLRQALNAAGFEEVRLMPAQSSIFLGKLRLFLEHWLHRALFLLGGHTQERVFTQNVIAVARKTSQ